MSAPANDGPTRDSTSGWPAWTEPDEETLARLVRVGTLGADRHVMDAVMRGATGAEQTRVAVQEALRVLLANGLVTAAPLDDDFYVVLDRPAGNRRSGS